MKHALAAGLAAVMSGSPAVALSPGVEKPRVVKARPASQPASQPARSPEYLLRHRGPYADTIYHSATKYKHDPHDIHAVLHIESGGRANPGRSSKGAEGMAQFTPGGRRALSRFRRAAGVPWAFTSAHALDPYLAIAACAEFLAYLRDWCGSWPRALGAYATGSCSKGASYARRVLRLSAWLRAQEAPTS